MKREHRRQRDLKVAAAALGGGALVAMGVLTAGAGWGQSVLTQPPSEETSTTETTAPTTPETPSAEPPVTATTPEGPQAPTTTVENPVPVEPTASTSETEAPAG